MEQNTLEKILQEHKEWLKGKGGKRANLSNADLRNADLCNADLRNADLHNADLWNADLCNADLRNADLRNADLWNADLRNADLRNADLCNADLRNADLCNADLCNANLQNIKVNIYTLMYHLQCPEEGSFIAWKKCRDNVIVKLEIPSHALRSSATSRKCRASEAFILDIIGGKVGVSIFDENFIYKKGETVKVKNFDTDRWKECASGIHFFITRAEAESFTL